MIVNEGSVPDEIFVSVDSAIPDFVVENCSRVLQEVSECFQLRDHVQCKQ